MTLAAAPTVRSAAPSARPWLVAAGVIGALFVAVAAGQPVAAQAPPARVLVLPFENTGSEARVQWLGEAAAVLVSDALRARGQVVITREERVRAYEELHLPLTATLSRATVIKVAQLLGAAQLVAGTFRVEDRALVVGAHIIRVDAGRVRPAVAERGELSDLFGVHDRLVERLMGAVRPAAALPVRPPLGAFENYIKGLLAASPAARVTFLEAAIQEFPPFDRARVSLWEVRTAQGEHDAALAAARAVTASSPWSGRARFLAATSLLTLQRYDAAFEVFSALTAPVTVEGGEAAPDRGAVYNNLGVIQLRRGATPQTGTAAYFLTKATEASPGEVDYLFNLGYAYTLERNFDGAMYWLREALRRSPADADAHAVLATALQATGNGVEAGRERDLARQLSARYEELARAAGDHLAVPRRLERVQTDPDGSGSRRAEVIVGSSLQRDQRDQAVFHLERARRLVDREQDGDALAELRRTVYLAPYEAQAHLLIGRIFLRAGRPQDAVDALKISVWSADGAPARLALSEAYRRTGDLEGARAEAKRALALEPTSAEAKRLLSEIK